MLHLRHTSIWIFLGLTSHMWPGAAPLDSTGRVGFKRHGYGYVWGVSVCSVHRKRKHEIRGLGKHGLSARFLETEGEEDAVAFLFRWPGGQGQPTLQLALSQVEPRVWLSRNQHRCNSWSPWLQPLLLP